MTQRPPYVPDHLLAGSDPVRCPRCQRPVTVYRFNTEKFVNCTYHCPQHGDVVPVPHRAEARPDWSAA